MLSPLKGQKETFVNPDFKKYPFNFYCFSVSGSSEKKVNECVYSVCVAYYYELEVYFKGAEKWLSDKKHLLCDSEDEFWSQHSCKPSS